MVVIDFLCWHIRHFYVKKTLRHRDLTLMATLYLGSLLFCGEYKIQFIECVEDIRIFTSAQHE